MKNRQKVFAVIAAISLGTFLTWYLQVYKNKNVVDAKKKGKLIATIPPLKYIANQIVGSDFDIITLLPEGVSPETYEPTPQQIIAASEAEIIFATGLLDFEKTIIEKIKNNTKASVSILSQNIQLIEDSVEHSSADHAHNHGVDPHIWTSLRCLKRMADNAYGNIKALYPDSSKYHDNYLQFVDRIEQADMSVAGNIAESDIKYFFIYHPALTYYSHDYNILQIALENEGKEPTADHMRSVIELAKQDSTKIILYQKQLTQSVVATIARDINAEPVAFDPLCEDVIQNILWVTGKITGR